MYSSEFKDYCGSAMTHFQLLFVTYLLDLGHKKRETSLSGFREREVEA
jgi:hypothetical protein